jgi:hypothetical protein
MAAMIFKVPAQFGLVDVDIEDPFQQPGPTDARRRTLRVSVIGCILCRVRNDFRTQLRIRCEYAMEANEM